MDASHLIIKCAKASFYMNKLFEEEFNVSSLIRDANVSFGIYCTRCQCDQAVISTMAVKMVYYNKLTCQIILKYCLFSIRIFCEQFSGLCNIKFMYNAHLIG